MNGKTAELNKRLSVLTPTDTRIDMNPFLRNETFMQRPGVLI